MKNVLINELKLLRKASILSLGNPNSLQTMMRQVRNDSNNNIATKIIFNHSQHVNSAALFTENDTKSSQKYKCICVYMCM